MKTFWGRRFRLPRFPRAAPIVILLYHRIARLRRDPWSLAVTPEQFESQLSIVGRCARPISVKDLDSPPPSSDRPAVAITFDDGYDDNFLVAAPLLRHYEIPATIFIVSGAIDTHGEFWWDELERVLLGSPAGQERIEIEIRGKHHSWPIAPPVGAVDDSRWQAWGDSAPSDAHRAYREAYDLLFPLTPAELASAMTSLRSRTGSDTGRRESHRTLSREQTRTLARSAGIDIGVHTVNHPCLALLPPAEQKREICAAKSAIDELTGCGSVLFSYPFGKREHFSEESVRIVREAGFRYACTNFPGLIRPETDRLQLPRVVAPPLEGEAFAAWLNHCFTTMN